MTEEIKEKKKIGRPSKNTEKRKYVFIKLLMQGERIKAASRKVGVCKATIFKWLNEDLEFADRYARARDIYIDNFIEEIIDETENVAEDKISIQKQKLISDVKLNILEKVFPKKYGKYVNVDHTLELMSERIKRVRAEDEAAKLAQTGGSQLNGSPPQLTNAKQITHEPEKDQ